MAKKKRHSRQRPTTKGRRQIVVHVSNPKVADGVARVLRKLGYKVKRAFGKKNPEDMVGKAQRCPTCKERRVDWLEARDDDRVRCLNCGTLYNAFRKRKMGRRRKRK